MTREAGRTRRNYEYPQIGERQVGDLVRLLSSGAGEANTRELESERAEKGQLDTSLHPVSSKVDT
jgi:hypothetical protein